MPDHVVAVSPDYNALNYLVVTLKRTVAPVPGGFAVSLRPLPARSVSAYKSGPIFPANSVELALVSAVVADVSGLSPGDDDLVRQLLGQSRGPFEVVPVDVGRDNTLSKHRPLCGLPVPRLGFGDLASAAVAARGRVPAGPFAGALERAVTEHANSKSREVSTPEARLAALVVWLADRTPLQPSTWDEHELVGGRHAAHELEVR